MQPVPFIQEIDRPPTRRPRFYDRFFTKLIRDPRDLAFIDLMLFSSLFVLAGIWLLAHPHLTTVWYIPYYLIGGFLLGPFILMVHNTCHRTLFKKQYNFLNFYIPWLLSPCFGLTPETYYSHHIGMHHPENNLKDDLSSTLPYRRDSLFDFLKYLVRFYFCGIFGMPRYFLERKRRKMVLRMLAGELTFYLIVGLVFFLNWRGALGVFLVPFVFTRFMMINGNWAQHAFVDAANPENNYKNSITCINSTYNRRCFNDGYHIVHHLQPTLHWQEVPRHLREQLHQYIENDAVVFEKIDYFIIWIFLMLKRYDWLARFFVDFKGEKRSREEIAAFLKTRTQPLAILPS